ncbi:nucleoside hydrolase [Paramicrobacterium fandaimingii]|uniref:nucleoside hydrolase n=1 Tax=Paramicrobacterium fandaimingii TaxID=2708079 RepID=UPI001421FDAB|nr:nucleoside hydrolase [Microbacterium fandaimingii]
MARQRWRVIIDNDFAGDPDGLASLAHLLVSDEIHIELVTSSPVDPHLAGLVGMDASTSAARGTALASELITIASGSQPPVVVGAESFAPELRTTAAAAAIAELCMADTDSALTILCGGPLINIAAAIALEPKICSRATLAWIGGSTDSSFEYNRDTDAASAAFVFSSGIPITQVTREAYEQLRVSTTEVEHDLAGASPVGAWVAERLLDVPPFVTLHGALTLGDSALASVIALDPRFDPTVAGDPAAPPLRRQITAIDTRLMWADFLAKLRLHGAAEVPA